MRRTRFLARHQGVSLRGSRCPPEIAQQAVCIELSHFASDQLWRRIGDRRMNYSDSKSCFAGERVERRLAAILVADVASYSRLMHANEERTHSRVMALLANTVAPAIARHGGRVVKHTGDGLLAEFASAVDAVRAAMLFQDSIYESTRDDAPDQRILLRVGINIGDVIVEAHDIFGDGVNIAARLEGVAEPGGICISQTVLNHARDKVSFEVEDAGEQTLKNIARPVHVYRIIIEPSRRPATPKPGIAALALPDKPSVAVLPFTNMSGDPEQEFVSDGVAEDVITALSRYPSLFVIARNSSFTYKGRAVD